MKSDAPNTIKSLKRINEDLRRQIQESDKEINRLTIQLVLTFQWAEVINSHPIKHFLIKKWKVFKHKYTRGLVLFWSIGRKIYFWGGRKVNSQIDWNVDICEPKRKQRVNDDRMNVHVKNSQQRDIILFFDDQQIDNKVKQRDSAGMLIKMGYRVFRISHALLQKDDPGYEIDQNEELENGYLVRLNLKTSCSVLINRPTRKELLLLKKSLACLLRDFTITKSVSFCQNPVWLSLIKCIPNTYRVFDLHCKFSPIAEWDNDTFFSLSEIFRSMDTVLVDHCRGEKIAKPYVSNEMLSGEGFDQQYSGDRPAIITLDEETDDSLQSWLQSADNAERWSEILALPSVSVIVLTYNNLELTKVCLQSVIERSQYANLEIIVVDNASTDGTIDYLREFQRHHSSVKIIANRYNMGFAAGNNLGLAAATGEYLVLLNNDTVVTEGWVLTLLHHLMDHSDIGLLGAVTNHIGNEAQVKVDYDSLDQMPERSRAYTLTHMGELLFLRTVAFFCVMMPRSTYARCGPISEEYGLGFFEDDDYCRKVEKLGLKIACAEDVFIHHHLSASFNKLREKDRRALFDRNRAIYEKKWGPWIPHRYRY